MKKLITWLVVAAMLLAMAPAVVAVTDTEVADALNGTYVIYDLQEQAQAFIEFKPESAGATKGKVTLGPVEGGHFNLSGTFSYDYANAFDDSYNDATIKVMPVFMDDGYRIALIDVTNLNELKLWAKITWQYWPLVKEAIPEVPVVELKTNSNNVELKIEQGWAYSTRVSYKAGRPGTYSFNIPEGVVVSGANASQLKEGIVMERGDTVTFDLLIDTEGMTLGASTNVTETVQVTVTAQATPSGGGTTNPGEGETNPGEGETNPGEGETNPDAQTEHHFNSLTDVTPGADKDPIAAGTTYNDGFFTVVGTVTQRYQASKGGVYAVELDKKSQGAIAFTTTGVTDVTIGVSSTGGSNTSAVALVDAEGNVVGEVQLVAGTSVTEITYENLPAGSYSVVSPEHSEYKRGARLMTIDVVPAEGETNPGEGETNPGEGETNPGEGETNPGEGETNPGEGETNPGEGETNPGEGETNPGEGETNPGEGETNPGEGETNPGEGETNPGEGETNPGEGETNPDAQNEYHFNVPEDVTPADADKTAIAAGTTYDDGFFTVVGNVTQRIDDKKGGLFAVELDKKSQGAIAFTTTGVTDVTIGVSSTGGSNTSAVALVDAEGNVVGEVQLVAGTSVTEITYENLPAGSYSVVSPEHSEYKRGARLMTIDVVPAEGETNPGEGETNPGEGETNPGEGETNPGEGETNPGEGETNPGEGETNPGEGETNPGEGETNPGEGETNPGEGETNPDNGDSTILFVMVGIAALVALAVLLSNKKRLF